MQIESLKAFCDLVETESFSKAAQINHLTQSGISQMVTALERQLKSPLIERNKKFVRLTPEGQMFYDCCRKIIDTFQTFEGKLQEFKQVVSGSINVSTVYTIGLHTLPARLKAFLRLHPTVAVHVAYRRAHEVYDDVLRNAADFGLIAYPEPGDKLITIPVGQDELVAVCHPQHALANLGPIKLGRLTGQNFIGFNTGSPTRQTIDQTLRAQYVSVHQVLEFDNIETIKQAVELGIGISIVPRNSVAHEIKSGALVQLNIEDWHAVRPLGVIHKKGKVLTPAMAAFLAALKAA